MLLAHQIGSVKIGEVVRYTVTYTPSDDRILPSPEFLYLRIRNTCNVALRAAFVHGPYTLCVAAYPSTFSPNEKFENPRRYGVPEFEPMLKAGGTWNCHLVVPDTIRQTAGTGSNHSYFGGGPERDGESVSWVVEVSSQVLFSASALVHYEILLARDEKSLNLGSAVPVLGGSQAQPPQPGRVSDFYPLHGMLGGSAPASPLGLGEQPKKGVFSRAIRLDVEDTAALWDKPQLPGWDEVGWRRAKDTGLEFVPGDPTLGMGDAPRRKTQKKVHLVVLTHGLHSNLGADLLFVKESIDAGVKQAKRDAKARKEKERAERRTRERATAAGSASRVEEEESNEQEEADDDDDDDDEEVVVRGFSGNATKTEKGVKYLGKRLARFVLSMTYPDQPFLPTAKAASEAITHTLKTTGHNQPPPGTPAHKHSTIHIGSSGTGAGKKLYKITKISFIAHSLGGLIQMYAIAYIQKHSPEFFNLIEPINFISLASPFLGLNHENPLYVNFALDFGLVGRTGQDLGLTWRAPTIARSGWGAIVSNLGENAHKHVYGEAQVESKPLLRILPTGPAHTALKKFRKRTVYSNVVNDGIVPLRTSCLLFLDWQGLGRVEKARREAGLVETVVGFGWAELTGANVTSPRLAPWSPEDPQSETETGKTTPVGQSSHDVPQPPSNAMLEDDRQTIRPAASHATIKPDPGRDDLTTSSTNNTNPFTGFFNLFRSHESPKSPTITSHKQKKIYQRSQTIRFDEMSSADSSVSSQSKVTSGQEFAEDEDGVSAPPRTTFFESAGDILNPKLPSVEYLIDPTQRPRTIFHDRIYHPPDIPPPPLKKRPTSSLLSRRKSMTRTTSSDATQKTAQSDTSSPFLSPTPNHHDSGFSQRDYDDTAHTNPDMDPMDMIDSSQMKVEEKIARAYHRGLSWRKVLVKLEPDAHNNIIARRMFANAFGWPVVHHLVEAHFSDAANVRGRDDEEVSRELAKGLDKPPDEHGEEIKEEHKAEHVGDGDGAHETEAPAIRTTTDTRPLDRVRSRERTASEAREAMDAVPELPRTPNINLEDKILRDSPSTPSSVSSVDPSAVGSPRPRVDRLDSVTWSDRDWADSGDESDSYGGESRRASYDPRKDEGRVGPGVGLGLSGSGTSGDAAQDNNRSASPPGGGAWNWTEKIVGKGATVRGRPRPPGDDGGSSAAAPGGKTKEE